MLKRIMIQNYRCFETLDLAFNPTMNIIVGDNDCGKSTILEAINLALKFQVGGRNIAQDLSPYLFNGAATAKYCAALRSGKTPPPPEFIIDLFLEGDYDALLLRGSVNLAKEDSLGVRVRASLSPEYLPEYEKLASDPGDIRLVPTEYYRVHWLGFSGNGVTTRSLGVKSSLIDASTIRLSSGADYYLQGILHDNLSPAERVELSRTYRSAREEFSSKPEVQRINSTLAGEKGEITDRTLSLAIDISQRFTWESNLVPHLDDLPVQFVGKGEQSTLKILLALGRSLVNAQVLLVEEPENHLSFSSLQTLIARIQKKCASHQIIVTTHSSYVLNKLGLDALILLGAGEPTHLRNLSPDTLDYFKKLSGYDTLRLVLAKNILLVEGPSDELIVQRAYRDVHGHLPLDDGVDVINVRGLSAKRFLDIAKPLRRDARVVTDNDGRKVADILAGFSEYTDEPFIKVFVGADGKGTTLEPQLVSVNGLEAMNEILGTKHATVELLQQYMENNKTTCALKTFEAADGAVVFPEYIRDAVTY